MQIFARFPFAALTVLQEGLLKKAKVIGFGTEIADVFTQIARLTDRHVHFRARVTVKTVAFHLGCMQI